MAETVLITGASAGFGKAMTETFIHSGYRVIGAARRLEKLGKLREALGEHFYPLQLDMTDTSSINKALANLPKEWSKIELLVNNAGLALGLDKAYEANFKDWETMIATNIIGLTYLTRQILPDMVARKSGHIINIGSTAGTYPYTGGNVYGASKAFVKQFSLNLRADLAGTKVRVTNIEPGLCGSTEFSTIRFKGDKKRAEQLYEGAHSIQPQDIANAVLWTFQQPKHVNINRIEIMPTSQSFGPQPVERDY
ncbi:SDR family oxidoreductase [Streptococcus mutans]|uniref:SDR family oxidoreductase n=1 Tax=Streptococcus mutans TaxID=1309 RepID=UPI0004643C32|nr:SDR family oxidoreductase [Streptococcus mutans]MCB5025968.1 SDR family oxidoreductase [Streptococcus mutans]